MKLAVVLLSVASSFAAMEWVAWATHKYLMHGPLWVLHRDHHRREGHRMIYRNDAFFVVFAIPSWLFIMLGSMHHSATSVALGAGIALYGVAYFLVHEVFIHRRLKFWKHTRSTYWTAVRRTHMRHHRHQEREPGECFGLLWVNRGAMGEARRQLHGDS
jgi:beta-carotene 3-hydroxylase